MSDLIQRLRATNKRVRHSQELRDEAADSLEQAQAVNEAANNLCNWIQRELEQHDGWTQFDFLPVRFDLFWFYQLQKALQSAGGSDRTCNFTGGDCSNQATCEVSIGNGTKWYACCDKHASHARRGKAEFRDLQSVGDSDGS